jgi:hypothetical protein
MPYETEYRLINLTLSGLDVDTSALGAEEVDLFSKLVRKNEELIESGCPDRRWELHRYARSLRKGDSQVSLARELNEFYAV